MKVFISVDMEGCAGVVDEQHWKFGEKYYDIARDLMAREANAAIEGALEAGAKSIIVNDSHSNMINLDAEKIHPEAELIIGRHKPMSMCQGMGPGFDAAIFVGYHGGRGALHAVLDHTYTGLIHNVTINGVWLNEALINGLVAGHFGCPLVLVTGDQAVAAEIKRWDEAIHTCEVKKSLARQAIQCIHPSKARDRIKAATKAAIDDRENIAPMRLEAPFTLEVELHNAQMADMLERVPGVERLDGRTVRAVADDMLTAYRYFMTIYTVSGIVYY